MPPRPTRPAFGSERSNLTMMRGMILVLCAGIFWSFIPLGARQFEHATVWHILLYRSVGMTPMVLLLIMHQSGGRSVQSIAATGVSGIIGGLALVAAYAGGIAAVRMISVVY